MIKKRALVKILGIVYLCALMVFLAYLLIGYASSDVANAYVQVSGSLGSNSVNVSKVQFSQEYEALLQGEVSKVYGTNISGIGVAGELGVDNATGGNPFSDNSDVSSKFLWPVPGFHDVSSTFGEREQVSGTNINTTTHNGLDITGVNIYGAPIIAVLDGVVLKASVLNTSTADEYSSAYGNYIILEHTNGLRTIYAHCSRLSVSKGDVVKRGQQIASVGSTGQSNGPHLHIAVMNSVGEFQDPANYLYK